MTEGEERLLAELVVEPIADEDALVVVHGAVHARVLRRCPRHALGVVRRERHRQLSRRVHVAEEDGGDRLAAALPWIPGLDDGRDTRQPRHQHRARGVKDDDGTRVCRGHCLDQRILIARQSEPAPVHALARHIVHEHHRDLGPARGRDGRLDERGVGWRPSQVERRADVRRADRVVELDRDGVPRRQVRQALEGLRRRADQAERRTEPLGVAVCDETAVDGEPRVAGVLEREAMRAGGDGRQRPREARGAGRLAA